MRGPLGRQHESFGFTRCTQLILQRRRIRLGVRSWRFVQPVRPSGV